EQLNDELTYILPGATRTYEYTWQPNSFIYQEPIELHGDENMTLKPGDAKYDEAPVYKTIYSTKFDWSNLSKIKFGKYSASIQYSADNDSDFADLEARTEIVSFYFVPIQIIVPAVVLLVLFALVIFFIGWRSKRSKTKMTSSMSPAENNMQMQAPAQSAAMQPQANATNM
ncbi:hypothetical protein KC678_02925, partial [Candidatus Dojkabacteria bacterium]|nr:hypothetical protein [Candidatus Dojkabacteria bacterium]